MSAESQLLHPHAYILLFVRFLLGVGSGESTTCGPLSRGSWGHPRPWLTQLFIGQVWAGA